MEGGNTRFCGQIILNSDDKEAMLAYNKAMAGDFAVDDELMDVYAEGLTQTKTMLRDFFGVPEENFLDWKEDSSAQPMIAMFVPEYPELEGWRCPARADRERQRVQLRSVEDLPQQGHVHERQHRRVVHVPGHEALPGSGSAAPSSAWRSTRPARP